MAWIAVGASVAGAATGWGLNQLGGDDPSFKNQTLYDPLKQAVANPMSSYLAGQIGQGVGNPGMDQTYTNRYQDFMGMNANDMFDKNVYQPQLKLYQTQQQPLIAESFAGGLRGSGHYGKEEEGLANWQAGMGQTRANYTSDMSKAQVSAGDTYNKQAYNQWYDSLPQNNPALKLGMDFLSNNTGTGTTVLSALDPGQQGWFSSLLNTLVGGISQQNSSNKIADAIKGLNQPATSSSSSTYNYEDTNTGNQYTSMFQDY